MILHDHGKSQAIAGALVSSVVCRIISVDHAIDFELPPTVKLRLRCYIYDIKCLVAEITCRFACLTPRKYHCEIKFELVHQMTIY